MELYNKAAAANPVIGKMSLFINSLLLEAYDDTPRKVSWFSLVWKCGYVVSKALYLYRAFYKNITVPQELLDVENGGQGIRTLNRLPGS